MTQYLVQDEIPYPCCLLLTAINARRFLDDTPMVHPFTDEFEFLVDLVGCRYGAAVSVRKAWRLFDLHVQRGPHRADWVMARLVEGRPVGFEIHTPDWGFHSTLCVGATHEHAYLVNHTKGVTISEVPWSDIDTPRFAYAQATAFAVRG